MITVALKDVATVVSGYGFPKSHQGNSGEPVPFYKVSDMNLHGNEIFMNASNHTVSHSALKEIKAKAFPAGTVIFPKIGAAIATNKKRILTKESAFDNNVMGLIPFADKLESKYLHYWLLRRDLSDWASKSELPSMRKSEVELTPIHLPEIDRQRVIVAKLDAAFENIDKATLLTKKNLENIQTYYDSSFQSLVSNVSGTRVTLADVCHINTKLVDPKNEPYLSQVHIGAANIEVGTGRLLGLKTAAQEKLISGKFPFDQNTILYSKIRPYLMKVARPSFCGICSADVYPLSPNDELNKDYLFYLLLSPEFTKYAINGSQRAGMPKVNREHLFAFEFDLPDTHTQVETVKKLDELLILKGFVIDKYNKKLNLLAMLKKSLISQGLDESAVK